MKPEMITSIADDFKKERDWNRNGLEDIEDVLTWDIREDIKIIKIEEILKTRLDGKPTMTDKIYKLNDSLLLENEKQKDKIKWLENGLKEIANGRDDINAIYVKQQAQSILDGEPTTADEYNDEDDKYFTQKKIVYISDINKEIAKDWNKKDTMQEDEKLVFKEQFGGDTGIDADY